MCKATQSNDIPVKMILNKFMTYLNKLITSYFKKSYRESEESSCLVIILLVVAKTFKKLLSKQVTLFMAEFFSQ